MNRVCLVGRITSNPELRYTDSGVEVCRFTLAVNRDFKNASGEYVADFIKCVTYRQTAKLLNEYVEKGDLIGIDGRIQTGSYTAQDGGKRYTTDVVVNRVEFLSRRREQESAVNKKTEISNDPFTNFGEQVSIDDNFLE